MTAQLGQICAQLVRTGWPDAVEALLAANPEQVAASEDLTEAWRLAKLARRVLGLDAEDFGGLAGQFRRYEWHTELASCGFPAAPRDSERGALGSLVPLFELMMEVSLARVRRGENQDLVVTLHLMAEYVCQLAWERVLGHGGDPLQLDDFVGQRWGTTDTRCPHSSVLRATARRSLNAGQGDTNGYISYLDKFHSRLGEALAQCAMNHKTIGAGERPDVGPTCPRPCGWVLGWGDLDERRELDARLRLALIFVESPVISLRHHAPVGHFFGVPSVAEISDGWVRTWERLSQDWNDGSNPLHGRRADADDASALPGLELLMSTIAGREMHTGDLLRRIGRDLIVRLEAARG